MGNVKQFEDIVRTYKRIAVDTNIFIYKFEQNSHFEPFCSVIFDCLSSGRIQLITSVITVSEILTLPFSKNNNELLYLYENVFKSMPHFTLVDIDYSLAKAAAMIKGKYNIRLPDAYQIAAALKENADVFITNDSKLEKVSDLKIISLKVSAHRLGHIPPP